MAITQVGTAKGGSAINSGDVTLTFDTSPNNPVTGDIVILFGGYSHAAAGDISPLPGPSTAGYTEIVSRVVQANAEPACGVWYKVMGGTPDTTVVGRGSASTTDGTAYGCVVLRGFNSHRIQDATVVVVGPTSSTNPNGGAIVTVADNARVIVCCISQVNDTSRGTLGSGWTNLVGGSASDTRSCSCDGGWLDKTPSGSTDPPAFPSWSSGVWYAFTIAIAPLQALNVTASPGSYSVAGQAATLPKAVKVSAAPGAYGVSGVAATLPVNRPINAEPGSYSVAGRAVTTIRAALMNAGAGTYGVSGVAAALSVNRLLNAGPGNYSLSGTTASLLREIVLNAGPGDYVLTGIDAELIYFQSGPAAYTLVADSGSYDVVGASVALIRGLVMNAAAGFYRVSGTDASLVKAVLMSAGAGVYDLHGEAASLNRGLVMNAAPGNYDITGFTAAMPRSLLLRAAPGVYILNGASILSVPAAGFSSWQIVSLIRSRGGR